MSTRTDIQWTDVSGLEPAKKALKEIIVLPFLRPYVLICAVYMQRIEICVSLSWLCTLSVFLSMTKIFESTYIEIKFALSAFPNFQYYLLF